MNRWLCGIAYLAAGLLGAAVAGSGDSDVKVKWPLVMIREAQFGGHADVLHHIVEIHGRRPSSVDEIWLG